MSSAGARRRTTAFAALGASGALAQSVAMWGFTVDDALISVRYAQSIASGAGFRFSPGAPPSDGVTPLPWAPLLALLSADDALTVLLRAKVLGVVCWTAAAARLGLEVGRATSPALRERAARPWFAAGMLLCLALVFPLGAHAASGMETGVVIAIATFAATTARVNVSACIAGVAAAFRPELLPWALTLAMSVRLLDEGAPRARARGALGALGLACGPFVGVALARLLAFGHVAPLAVLAKPSDLAHGARYAVAAFIVTAIPVGLLAPGAFRRAGARPSAIALATLVHFFVIAVVGGDWMPYARLATPVLPAALLACVWASAPAFTRTWSAGLRLALTTVAAVVSLRAAPAGRGVMRDRTALVHEARPKLRGARTIAALDVGWLSAAAPHARIMDLAGVTERAIAALPGGHTSKRVDLAMLREREVDTLITLSRPRLVEARLMSRPEFADTFAHTGTLDAGRAGRYLVWTRR